MMKQYIGRKINVITNHFTRTNRAGEIVEYDHVDLSPSDPVITEIMSKHACVRFVMPDMFGTCDYDMSRLNVHIAPNEAGDYVITDVDWG